jgi:transposase-like protein
MIQNYKCTECDHRFVCKKMSVLEKFDDESKKYINIDISIIKCLDYINTDESGEDDVR